MVMLAMTKHQANLTTARHLVDLGFSGYICAIAPFEDQIEELRQAGVHAPFNFYDEAGLGFAVDFGKPGGFLGEAALLKQAEQPLTRRLIQFLVTDPEPLLYHDEPIWRDDIRVGRTTSGMYGHTLGGAVGLGYVEHRDGVDDEFVTAGHYTIEIAGQRYPATANLSPLYDPSSKRARG